VILYNLSPRHPLSIVILKASVGYFYFLYNLIITLLLNFDRCPVAREGIKFTIKIVIALGIENPYFQIYNKF